MGADTKIQWCDFTFNHIRGCSKVAAGCTNCYADAQAKRNPGVLGVWGPNGTRVIASEDMWKQPLKWNREAQCNCGAAGMGDKQCKWCEGGCKRPRVFCASLADIFEEWSGPIVDSRGAVVRDELLNQDFTLDDVRARLFKLIDSTPNLDWLLLTKRPENILKMWPEVECSYCGEVSCPPHKTGVLDKVFRENVWLGTSIAEQADADRNIPLLLKCRDLAPVLFVSAEPLIGSVNITRVAQEKGLACPGVDGIDWVIAGGESGHHARPCHVDWMRSIVRQCREAGVPCFVKQLGKHSVASFDDNHAVVTGRLHLSDDKGGDPDEWPEDLRVREFPRVNEKDV